MVRIILARQSFSNMDMSEVTKYWQSYSHFDVQIPIHYSKWSNRFLFFLHLFLKSLHVAITIRGSGA